jgi:hypothetical protein
MTSDPIAQSTPPSALDLNAARAFMLTTLRLWFNNQEPDVFPLTRWQDGFDAAGIGTVDQHSFDTLLKIVCHAAPFPLQVQRPGAHLLSKDELRFLEVLDLLQNMHHDDACKTLGDWLHPMSAQTALFFAIRVADALERVGLKMEHAPAHNAHRINIASSGWLH